MAQQYKCVIFDVDGTLLDTSEGMLSAVRYTIAKFGLAPLDEATIKSFIGPPIQHSFQRVYGFADDVIADMAAVFRDRYKDKDLLLAEAYDGIFDVLDYLRRSGMRIAIATYKREDYATRLLHAFGFDQYTDLIFGSDFEGRLKKRHHRACLKKRGHYRARAGADDRRQRQRRRRRGRDRNGFSGRDLRLRVQNKSRCGTI